MTVSEQATHKALTAPQVRTLIDIGHNVGRASAEAYVLEQYGLCHTGKGRYGTFARLSEKGKQHLSWMESQKVVGLPSKQVAPAPAKKPAPNANPAATTGPAKAGTSLRGAAPRHRRNAAT